jgi:ATP-binding cassette subfamily B protein
MWFNPRMKRAEQIAKSYVAPGASTLWKWLCSRLMNRPVRMKNVQSVAEVFKEMRRVGVFPLPFFWTTALVLSVAGSALSVVALGSIIRYFVNTIEHTSGVISHSVSAGLIFLALGSAVCSALRVYSATLIGEVVGQRLRYKAFANTLEKPLAYFEIESSGDITSAIVSDVSLIQLVLRSSISPLIRNIIVLLAGALMMTITSPHLTLISLLALPLPLMAVISLSGRQKKLSSAVQSRLGALAGKIDEIINGFFTVKVMGGKEYELEEFSKFQQESFSIVQRMAAARSITLFFATLSGLLTLWALLQFVQNDLATGAVTLGGVSAFLFYCALVAGSASTLGSLWGSALDAISAFERVSVLCDALPPEQGETAVISEPSEPMSVRFQNVSFWYRSRPNKRVFLDLNFFVAEGEVVALAGASGAGKSTIVRLLAGLDSPQAGNVLIGGVDVVALPERQLRRRLSVVPQDAFIFSTTLADNIRYGTFNADVSDIETAAKRSGVSAFSQYLESGLDTHLGARGSRLSGGQRQRVAIARSLIRPASIVVFDEPTSSLDAVTENIFHQNLRKLRSHATVIIITHKISTLKIVDRVILLDEGKVVEDGTHAHLSASSELYRSIFKIDEIDSSLNRG